MTKGVVEVTELGEKKGEKTKAARCYYAGECVFKVPANARRKYAYCRLGQGECTCQNREWCKK